MNMRFKYLFLVFIATSLPLSWALTTRAAALSGGTFVKSSESTVYRISDNGKRYVYPNYSTFRSWFMDPYTGLVLPPEIVTLTNSELSAYPLGGMINQRPGIRMVKIQTDPKVYAVSPGGILHWIPTEALARELYGVDWNQRIDDVPVEFFTNYIVDVPIALTEMGTLNYSRETGSVTTPDDDLRYRANYRPTPLQTEPYTGPQD